MRRYETIFILRADLGEPAHKEAINRFETLIGAHGGELFDTEEWGIRELSYRIKGEQRGFYVRFDYGGSGATLNEIERNLKIADSVLRYLSVLVSEAVDPIAARAELVSRRQKAAEARAAAEAARAAAETARLAAAAERASQQAAAAEAAAPQTAVAEAAAPEPAAAEAAAPDQPDAAEDAAPDRGSEQQS